MKHLVVYSSQTGNTAKVAQAIFEILPEPKQIHPVATAPEPLEGDFIALGFWVDKGRPDAKTQAYMKKLSGATIGLFGTLGADPESTHAAECLQGAIASVSGNRVVGTFLCRGRIAPEVIEAMRRTAADVHPMTPERIARIKAAESHPDATDLLNAQHAFSTIMKIFRERETRCVG